MSNEPFSIPGRGKAGTTGRGGPARAPAEPPPGHAGHPEDPPSLHSRRDWLGKLGLGLVSAVAACSPSGSRTARAERQFSWPDRSSPTINPARGFYVQISPADHRRLLDLRDRESISLSLLALDLRDYRTKALDEDLRRKIDATMEAARQGAVRIIFRAAYGFTDGDYRADPANLDLIRNHIIDLARWLEPWTRDLLAVQAGMLGPWGEWHGSTHGDPPSARARQLVWSTWREHLPARVPVLLRRPRFIRDLAPASGQGIPPGTGWHNDALFALPDDMGTYDAPEWDRERELAWCGRAGFVAPCGGETVPLSEATPPARVIIEMEKLGITFLNRDYHPGTLRRWEQSRGDGPTVRDEIARRLGYCLVPVSARWIPVAHDTTELELFIRNHGFAPPHGAWKIESGWQPDAGGPCQTFDHVTSASPGHWLPGHPNRVHIRLPAIPGGARGKFAIRIHDEDADGGSIDARQCIQFTGPSVSIDNAGWNVLDLPLG